MQRWLVVPFAIWATLSMVEAVAGAEASAGEDRCLLGGPTLEVLRCPDVGATSRGSSGTTPASRVGVRTKTSTGGAGEDPSAPGYGETEGLGPRGGARARARSRDLLFRQIGLARRLVERTRRGDAELPQRRLALADLYEELVRSIREEVRALDEPLFEAERTHRRDEARRLAGEQGRLEEEMGRARERAIVAYRTLAEEHPDFPRRDEALFRSASMLEEQAGVARQLRERSGSDTPSKGERSLRERARVSYHALIKSHPASPFVAHAYLAFAEHYFDEGQMPEALRFYEKVASYSGSPVEGYALYKSAWCHINLRQDREALSAFVRVIEHSRAAPESPMSGPLARQSRQELVGPFARALPPRRAWAFFRRVGGDHATEMMELLAQHYFDQGAWERAAAAYHTLMAEHPEGHGLCLYQRRAAECALRSATADDRVVELRRTVDLMRTYVAGEHPGAEEQACRSGVAQLLLDVATAWHQEAVGTDRSPGTDDEDTLRRAGALYELAARDLPDLDDLDLDGWAPEARPTRYRVAYWAAEIAWQLGQHRECGPAFDRVLSMDPAGEYTEDAAYGSVLCYDRVYQAELAEADRRLPSTAGEEAEASRPAPRELGDLELGMLRSFTRYLCSVPDGPEAVRIRYRRAAVLYAAGQLDVAAPLFLEVATDSPDHELAPYAAHRYLDCLNTVARREPGRRGACLAALESATEGFIGDERLMAHDGFAPTIGPIHAGALWQRAEEHAAGGRHLECARLYRRIYDTYRGRIEGISGHDFDEVLYNEALCFEEDYRIGQAISTRLELIREFGEGSAFARHKGSPSPLARRARYQVGGNYHAIAAYTKAAEFYEGFAERAGGEAEAPEALRTATVFRLGLGQDDRALENSALFERAYGRARGHEADAATVVYSVGEVFVRQRQWREAERHYRSFLRRYGKVAGTDEVIGARTRLARALWQMGPTARGRAVAELSKVVATADRRRPAEEPLEARLTRYRKMVRGHGATDSVRAADQTKRVARMVTDVARARFFLGEVAYERFDAIALPSFRSSSRLSRDQRGWWTTKIGRQEARQWQRLLPLLSPSDRRSQIGHVQFAHWIHTTFRPWLERRESARVAAEELYVRTVAEDVPEWEIAASARVGDMHRALVTTLYDLPTPPAIRGDPELESEWETEIDGAAEPHRRAAIGAYERCLTVATRNRWFNDWSRGCELALHRLAPREYPVSDELRAEPAYAAVPVAAPSLLRSVSP